MNKPNRENNNGLQNSNETSTKFDEKFIEESLKQYAHILHDYLIVLNKECQTKN